MKRALVLSGGGARCFAQLGYVNFLENIGIKFDIFSGSSGGAIIAAFLAKGYSAKETYEILKDINYKKYIKFNFLKGSIFYFKDVKNLLIKNGLYDFENLKHKLYVCITDYETYETIYVDSGDLADYLLASVSLIPIFEPYPIGEKVYIDGGFTDNLPVTPCKEADFICAINVNPPVSFKNTFFGNLYRAGYIMLNNNIKFSKKLADRYIEIEECSKFGIFDTKNFDNIYMAGYKKAKKDKIFWEKVLR